MTTEFRIGVDWTRKGIICWNAWPGDALNLLPRPLTYTTVDWCTTNVTSADNWAHRDRQHGAMIAIL